MSDVAGPGPSGETPLTAEPPTHGVLDVLWSDPKGWWGQLTGVQNGKIGARLLLTGFFFLILGGSLDSVAMRAQLAFPEADLIGPELYNQLFTNHGSVTMFLVILPIFEGFSILLLPLILGSREMPFPRLGAFAYWAFLMGGLLYYSSTLFQLVPDIGWFAYTPLSGPEYSPGLHADFWILGLGVAEVGAIAAAVEIIIAVLKMRAPGMTLSRVPLFAWAVLVMAFMILFAFTPLIVASLLLELDRGFGTQFFDPQQGGSSLLWQHLFWIFGHPEVYIQFVPAAGVVSMIVPVFSRHRTVGYAWMVAALVAIGFLAFGLWAHHMFATGLPPLVLSFFAAASMVIAIPAGVQFIGWIATIWAGRVVWSTAFLFVIGFLIVFLIGGVTGVMVASVPFDLQAHDTYFIVAHLHYVLIGGVAFPIFAGVYYWFPKFTGRMLDERLGRWNFWLLFIGVNVTFFPQHIVGLLGMPRRVYTYDADLGWGIYNLLSSIGVAIIVPGMAVFVWNVVRSYRKGADAPANPWGADTLEWATPSPGAQHSWTVHPIVRSRHPLWDQDDLHRGDAELERLAAAIGRWPLDWRAAIMVGTADARPQEVFRVAGPSLWPLITAGGLVLIFLAELAKIRWAALVGALTVIVGGIGWNWPERTPTTEEEEERFEQEFGVPVNAGGSVIAARWGMGLAVLFAAIAFSSFVLAYFYLRLENPAWPPPGVHVPDLVGGGVAGAIVVASALAARTALARIRAADQRGFVAGLAIATATLVAGIAVQVYDLTTFGLAWRDHAYGSIVYTLAAFLLVAALGAAIMGGAAIYWAARGLYTARRHASVANIVWYWIAAVVMWLLGFGVLYLGPRLT